MHLLHSAGPNRPCGVWRVLGMRKAIVSNSTGRVWPEGYFIKMARQQKEGMTVHG
jgi:hypothetical protein